MFLKAGELNSPLGLGGHPQLLVLFDREVQLEITLTTLDHLAFEIPLAQYEIERARLQEKRLELVERRWTGEYAWLRARSLFFDDPEGNTIELIAHDQARAGISERTRRRRHARTNRGCSVCYR